MKKDGSKSLAMLLTYPLVGPKTPQLVPKHTERFSSAPGRPPPPPPPPGPVRGLPPPCLLLLRPDRAPPSAIASSSGRRSAVSIILGCVIRDQTEKAVCIRLLCLHSKDTNVLSWSTTGCQKRSLSWSRGQRTTMHYVLYFIICAVQPSKEVNPVSMTYFNG